ncbi:acyl-CoA dehydrogenase family protein [Seohaeicola zhoushanensis]
MADSLRLGAPDEGWSAAIRVLSIERATNRMYRPWRFEAELRSLLRACKSDAVLARRLDDSDVQRRVGEIVGQIDGLKGLIEASVEHLESGAPIGARGSLSKFYWSECHQAFAGFAYDLLAQVGPQSSPLARRAKAHFTTGYLFARAETIYAGVSEVQLDIIAQRILNLAKDK